MSAPDRSEVHGAELATLGAATAGGWVLHDVAVFLEAGWPPLAVDLLPGSLVWILAGALVGWTLARGVVPLVLLLLVALTGAVAPFFVDLPWSRAVVWLPRAATLMLLTLALGAWLRARRQLGVVALGLGAGVLACALHAAAMDGEVPLVPTLVGAAALLLPSAALRRASVRALAVALVLGAGLAVTGRRATRALEPSRADLPPAAAAAPGAPSLVLIVLDTVRADHLAPYGYERVTTPSIDAFAGEHATRYARARSTSPITAPSHASLFTGRYQAELPPGPRIEEGVATLASRLRAAGHRTGAVVANSRNLRPALGFDRGFEHYDDRDGGYVGAYLALAQLAGGAHRAGKLIYRDATAITDAALEWLDRAPDSGPFFLALNYMDAHYPYLPPWPFERAFGAERPRDPLAPPPELLALLYDRELAYLDSEVGRLLDGLRARGGWDDTVIVITSDHGEALGDHGFWQHGWTLYEELLHVPLYVKPAGARVDAVRDETLTGVDAHDLILAEVGLPREPAGSAPGVTAEWYYDRRVVRSWERRLKKDLQRDLIAWIEGDTKFIVASDGSVEVYDLLADPRERSPRVLSPDESAAALVRARDWWASHSWEGADVPELDAETEARLRALGYGGD